MLNTKTLTGLPKWFTEYEIDEAELSAKATVYTPIDGSHSKVVSVCEVDCLECDDGNGEQDVELVREGKGAARLANLCLIVHAPEMLDCIRRTLAEVKNVASILEKLVDSKTDITKENKHNLWVRLCESERELENCEHDATDLDSI